MSEEKYDTPDGKRPKVLGLLMANGLMMASEGTLVNFHALEALHPGWFNATDIESGERFLINLRHVVQIREVLREDVFRTGNIIRPGNARGRFN